MRKIRRRLLVGAAAGLTGLFVALLLRPDAVAVDTARVKRGPLEVALEEQGVTRIEPRFTVASPTAGRLLRVALREGDAVRKGDLVAELLPAPLDPRAAEQARATLRAALANQEEAEARVAEAEAAHRQAKRTLARRERLAADGQVAAEDLDHARTAERMAREALDAARHRTQAAAEEVARARAALAGAQPGAAAAQPLELTATADGRVLRVFERSERVVAAGTPLLELGEPADLEVVVDVLTTDAVSLEPGALMLLDAGSTAKLRARLHRIEPAAFTKVSPLGVEEQRVRVIGEVGEAGRVGDGYRVEARIVLWRGASVLQVPTGAVFRHGDGWAAFAVDGRRARLRPLRIGHRNADQAEVLTGLREGDRVVLYPPEQVEDGARLESAER